MYLKIDDRSRVRPTKLLFYNILPEMLISYKKSTLTGVDGALINHKRLRSRPAQV